MGGARQHLSQTIHQWRCQVTGILTAGENGLDTVPTLGVPVIGNLTIYRLPRWHSDKRIRLPMQEMREMRVQSLGWEGPLEKDMATHCSILAWRTPWTGAACRLVLGVARVRHDWACVHALLSWYIYPLIQQPHFQELTRQFRFAAVIKDTWLRRFLQCYL